MLEILLSGGPVMVPILICSLLMVAIGFERLWSLTPSRIAPAALSGTLLKELRRGPLTREQLASLRENSPLGRILAGGVATMSQGRHLMKETMQEIASGEMHRLERFMSILGTIAVVSPLLGLLGTVVGMIEVFNTIMSQGAGDARVLAGGISQSLITTAAGLTVAIPAVILHRQFLRRLDGIAVSMEQAATALLEFCDDRDFDQTQHTAAARVAVSGEAFA